MAGGTIMEMQRGKKIIEEVIRQICLEFAVSRAEVFQVRRGKENLLRLMAIFLATETSALPAREIAAVFQGKPAGMASAGRRFKKYLKFIPGLSKEYKKLKKRIIKKADGF